jgi:hypothetical protein
MRVTVLDEGGTSPSWKIEGHFIRALINLILLKRYLIMLKIISITVFML